jgi:IS5 family transposase
MPLEIVAYGVQNIHDGPLVSGSPINVSDMRTAHPQISFADLELTKQGVELDPMLAQIADFIDEHDELIEGVRRDLNRGLKKPSTGRNGLTPRQVLGSLILMRVKDWDYRELRERIADGYTLRIFTDFYAQSVPKHDAFNRSFNRLTPATLQAINNAVVQAAVDAGFEDGAKLRVDTTVVESNIHWPTDGTLLWDTVRVLTRLIGQMHQFAAPDVPKFRNRKRAARRRMQRLQRMTRAQRQSRQVPTYRQLLTITEEVLRNARRTIHATRDSCGRTAANASAIAALRKEIADVCHLGDRVLDQARRRVLNGEQVPTSEKLYSIFEPHTDLIKRGKTNKPVEFGHKVFLAESAQGLITQYRVLDGNPSDDSHVETALKSHKKHFGSAPQVFASDRGFYNPDNLKHCQKAGVDCVSIPQRGGNKTADRQAFEKSPAFKKAQRFRAGIEGTISVLLRGRGMRRCLAHGIERFALLIGAAVLANNLMRIARLFEKKHPRPRAA